MTILFVMACSQTEYISQKEDENINIDEQYNQSTNTVPLAEDIIKTSAFLWSGWVSNGKVFDQNVSMDEKCELIYPEFHLKNTLDHLSEADMKNMVLRHKAFLVKDPSNHPMHEGFGVPDHFSLRGPEGDLIANEYRDFFDPAFSLDSTLTDAKVFTDTSVSYSDTIFNSSFKDPYWLGYKLENDTLRISSGNELCDFWKEDRAINSTSSSGTLGNGNGASADHRFALMPRTPNSSQASKQAQCSSTAHVLCISWFSDTPANQYQPNPNEYARSISISTLSMPANQTFRLPHRLEKRNLLDDGYLKNKFGRVLANGGVGKLTFSIMDITQPFLKPFTIDEATGDLGVDPQKLWTLYPDHFYVDRYEFFNSFRTYDLSPVQLIVMVVDSENNMAIGTIIIKGAISGGKDGMDCDDKINNTSTNDVDVPDDVEKWFCKYTQPTPLVNKPTTTVSHLNSLPHPSRGLAYPRDKYELVFEDDFLGDGINSLDSDLWLLKITTANCNVPSLDVSDGQLHLRLGGIYNCNTGINTKGKFEFKYGYLEAKLTDVPDKTTTGEIYFNILTWGKYLTLQNSDGRVGSFRSRIDSFILSGNDKLKKQLRALKHLGIEKDIFEYRSSTQQACLCISLWRCS